MKYILKSTAPAAVMLLFATAGTLSARAQSDAELAVRVTQMEEQMRHLMGEVEQLNYQVQQLQSQLAGQHSNTGSLDPQPPPNQPPAKKKQVAAAQSRQAQPAGRQGVEEIGDDVHYSDEPGVMSGEDGQPIHKAPGPKILGTLRSSDLQGSTVEGSTLQGSTFEGQVLVPPASGGGAAKNGGQALMPPASSGDGQVLVQPDGSNNLVPESVETVSLGPASGDDPEAVYERSYENLLRRQFGEAESGFRTFLDKHRDHSLAGNAQYWLGETYYVQGDYKQAAQAFLLGYRDFPKSRKAADSLLKLGLSLNQLGQKQQACSAYSQVDTQFPKATEARKRAQAELKRAGC